MKKDIKFSTRMASADREAIKELAKRSGMSMSDYVTACCLGKQVVVVDGLKEVLKELKSIGRNLNQLVTLAHMGRITVVNLDSVRQAFSELCAPGFLGSAMGDYGTLAALIVIVVICAGVPAVYSFWLFKRGV